MSKKPIDPKVAEILKPYHEDMKRYMGALKEDFEHKVSAIGEQYFDLKKDIANLKVTQDSHTEMIGQILVDMTDVKNSTKIKTDNTDFVKLEKRVSRLEAKAR